MAIRQGTVEGMVSVSTAGRLPKPEAYAGKRVLVTGHTGFKGAWLAIWLRDMGADVLGVGLSPEATPNLFDLAGVGREQRLPVFRDPAGDAFADLRDELLVGLVGVLRRQLAAERDRPERLAVG